MGKHGKRLITALGRSVHQLRIYSDDYGVVPAVKPSGYKQWIQ